MSARSGFPCSGLSQWCEVKREFAERRNHWRSQSWKRKGLSIKTKSYKNFFYFLFPHSLLENMFFFFFSWQFQTHRKVERTVQWTTGYPSRRFVTILPHPFPPSLSVSLSIYISLSLNALMAFRPQIVHAVPLGRRTFSDITRTPLSHLRKAILIQRNHLA